MTKLLHVSDTHLGNRQYRSEVRRDDFADGFDAAVDIALDEGVDAVVHTGDLFDDPSPNVPTVNRCLDTVRRLDDSAIPFYAIVGNHERKREQQWLDMVKRFDNVTRLTREPTVVRDGDGNDPVSLYGIDAVRTPAWKSADFTLADCPDDHASVLCMHELLEPLVPPHRGDPYDLEADVLDRLNFLPDGLALGDYHSTCQTEKRGVKAFYPGATERCTVAETGNPSVYVIEIENGDLHSPTTRTIESAGRENTPRDFRVVNVEFEPGHGIEFVDERVREEAGTDDLAENVVVVRLRGADVPVTVSDVYDLLADHRVAVPRVDDKRVAETDLDFEFAEDPDTDIDQLLDEGVAELDLSTPIVEADDLVRSPDWEGADTETIREETNRRVRRLQEERFGEATIEGRR